MSKLPAHPDDLSRIANRFPDLDTVREHGRDDGQAWEWSWTSLSRPLFYKRKPPVPSVDQETPPAYEAELQEKAQRLCRKIDERGEQMKERLEGRREQLQVEGNAAKKRYEEAQAEEEWRKEKLVAVKDRLDEAPRPTLSRRAMYAIESITAVAEGSLASVAFYGIDFPLIVALVGGTVSGIGVASFAHDLGKRARKTNRSAGENAALVAIPTLLLGYVYGVSWARFRYMTEALGMENAGFTFWLFAAVSLVLIGAAFAASYAAHTEDLEFNQLTQKKDELEEEVETLRGRRQEAEEEVEELGSEVMQVESRLQRLPQLVTTAQATVDKAADERTEAYRSANIRARPDGEVPRCWRSNNGASA